MRTIWLSLLAPPAAWSIQEMLGWFFGERTCGAMTPPSVRIVVFIISVAALLVSLAACAASWRAWRASTVASGPLATDAVDRVEFMALGGFLVAIIFTIAIVWAGLSSGFIGDCGRIR